MILSSILSEKAKETQHEIKRYEIEKGRNMLPFKKGRVNREGKVEGKGSHCKIKFRARAVDMGMVKEKESKISMLLEEDQSSL